MAGVLSAVVAGVVAGFLAAGLVAVLAGAFPAGRAPAFGTGALACPGCLAAVLAGEALLTGALLGVWLARRPRAGPSSRQVFEARGL